MDRNSALLSGCILLCGFVAAAEPSSPYRLFTAERRTFSCDFPALGWYPVEEDTPFGSSVHLLGPVEADGAFRAAYHIHFLDGKQPGFLPIDEAVKREREPEETADRDATSVQRRRVAKRSARRFEVTETRQLPSGRLPSKAVTLHHYYAMIPAGDGYFIVKLSTTRETYLDYKKDFERVLDTFRVLGYP